MPNPSWNSRWSASPWWPLVLWLGGPATVSNLSIWCWQTLYLHHVVTSSMSGTGTGYVWAEALQFAMMAAFVLFLVQFVVASLVLVCGPGGFWQRMVVYGGIVAWLGGSYGASILLGFELGRWLETGQTAGWFIHDSYPPFTSADMFAAVASLPLVLLGFQSPFSFLRVLVDWRLQRTTASERSDE